MAVKDMDSLELGKLLLEKGLANQEHAESLILQDIDGVILSSMSAEQLTSVLGYTFGKAMRLVNWLRANVIRASEPDDLKPGSTDGSCDGSFQSGKKAKMVIGEGLEKHISSEGGREAKSVVSEKGSRDFSIDVKPLSLNKKRMRKTPSHNLPPDPVIDGADLYCRVFGKKPAEIPSTAWGKGYLEKYHPKAHATHNRNVERMRGFFSNVYDPVVAKAWRSNFKQEKISYRETLEFIETCVPDLEELVLTIRGVSMHIDWKAEDILRGWFLDHKKHHSSRRIAQIEANEAEHSSFLESLPSATHNNVGEATYLAQSAEDDDVTTKNDSPVSETTEILDQESTTEIVDVDSQNLNESQTSDATLMVESAEIQGYNDAKASKSVVLEGSQITNYTEQKSPEHKRQKLSLVMVGMDNGLHTTRAPLKELFSQDLNAIPGGLKRRCTSELAIVYPTISDTSTDAHSPNQSMTSTETDDSIKLKHPKKQIEEIYAAAPPNHEEFSAKSKKISKLSSVRNPKNESSKENCLPTSVVLVGKGKLSEGIPITLQALGIENLDEDAKLTIAYKAMKLSNKKEVKPQLKSFMATQNNRVQLLNERASLSQKMSVPFSGHKKLELPALLDLLVKWALEFKVEIVNGPKPVNGKVRLFSQHIQDKL